MIEVTGDLWKYPADARVIPTNGQLTRGGRLVMGAGVAKYARDNYKDLDVMLGQLVSTLGNHVYAIVHGDENLIAFPTKDNWRDPSIPSLIETGVHELIDLADRNDWEQVAMPRVGCGLGGLTWETVRSILEPLDDRFHVLTLE